MDNTALARFITSLGTLNGYGSTVYQTKQALDLKSTKPLNNDPDDIAIFNDSLNGIAAIKKIGFSTDGIISINKEFKSASDEQPNMPGHLRNANYNPDDRTAILISNDSKDAYFPPDVVTKSDLNLIVEKFNDSDKSEQDAWKVFVEISKLQPFQDGNKRTALIAANDAYGTLENEKYLILPINDLDRAEFTLMLMRYYSAKNETDLETAFSRMMKLLPNDSDRLQELSKPIEEEHNTDLSTRKIKRELRD
ncbi:Fic family protein [Companilactobacillus mishanensis]|uniref:Fic family protein n=1 Tax=Companilactobacillus mishanensis TaxID=2486008 RepID=A0A5P0ZJA3_9LACO|nr:Fic family protein [Companilactobacillus mishanensis]MQS53118.1 Fic family protein [Companilactobacillus mishanensis]